MTNAAKGWLAFDDPDVALVAANSAAGGILDIMKPARGRLRSQALARGLPRRQGCLRLTEWPLRVHAHWKE